MKTQHMNSRQKTFVDEYQQMLNEENTTLDETFILNEKVINNVVERLGGLIKESIKTLSPQTLAELMHNTIDKIIMNEECAEKKTIEEEDEDEDEDNIDSNTSKKIQSILVKFSKEFDLLSDKGNKKIDSLLKDLKRKKITNKLEIMNDIGDISNMPSDDEKSTIEIVGKHLEKIIDLL